MKKKAKYLVIVVFVLIGVLLFKAAKGLVELSGLTGSEVVVETSESSGVSNVLTDREFVRTARGVVQNQVGTPEEKSIQCVYDFFSRNLKELKMDEEGYEIRKVGENEYCVNVGDWYIFVKHESNISYPYKFTKSKKFIKDEKRLLLKEYENSTFEKEGDIYVWEVNE